MSGGLVILLLGLWVFFRTVVRGSPRLRPDGHHYKRDLADIVMQKNGKKA
jgi:hypothetical protein